MWIKEKKKTLKEYWVIPDNVKSRKLDYNIVVIN